MVSFSLARIVDNHDSTSDTEKKRVESIVDGSIASLLIAKIIACLSPLRITTWQIAMRMRESPQPR